MTGGAGGQGGPDPLRIGTRRTELAVRLARSVQSALTARGVASEIVTIGTAGDKRNAEPFTAITATGLFTAELEKALARRKVDCCVHLMKHLPVSAPDGLVIAAVLPRDDPRDALVITPVTGASNLRELPPGSRVGTSSLRERALLVHTRPDLEAAELRGDLPARLRKLDRGTLHAAVLPAAGLDRLEAGGRVAERLQPVGWLPAPGQGAIGLQARSDDERVQALLRPLNHEPTAVAVRAERRMLAELDDGLQMPLGALVTDDGTPTAPGDRPRRLHAFISDLLGHQFLTGSAEVREEAPEEAASALAQDLRARGAASLLVELRATERVPAPQPE